MEHPVMSDSLSKISDGIAAPLIYPLYVFNVIPNSAHKAVFVMHKRPRSASMFALILSPPSQACPIKIHLPLRRGRIGNDLVNSGFELFLCPLRFPVSIQD